MASKVVKRQKTKRKRERQRERRRANACRMLAGMLIADNRLWDLCRLWMDVGAKRGSVGW